MAIVWPVGLVNPQLGDANTALRQGYQYRPEKGFIATQFETGPERRNLFTSNTPIDLSCSVHLYDIAQVDIFWGFYYEDAAQGVNWFDMPLLVTRGAAQVHQARFESPPSVRPNGELGWLANMPLKLRELKR